MPISLDGRAALSSYSRTLQAAAHCYIPGGHTYNKGDDQYPDDAPPVLVRSRGCRVWDVDGNEFIEYAEALLNLIEPAEQVKFSEDGSSVSSAAIRAGPGLHRTRGDCPLRRSSLLLLRRLVYRHDAHGGRNSGGGPAGRAHLSVRRPGEHPAPLCRAPGADRRAHPRSASFSSRRPTVRNRMPWPRSWPPSRFYRRENVIYVLYARSERLRTGGTQVVAAAGLEEYVQVFGKAPNLVLGTKDVDGQPSQPFRTLFTQELVRRGILAPSLGVSFSHTEDDIDRTVEAVEAALPAYRRALEGDVGAVLEGSSDSAGLSPVRRPSDEARLIGPSALATGPP